MREGGLIWPIFFALVYTGDKGGAEGVNPSSLWRHHFVSNSLFFFLFSYLALLLLRSVYEQMETRIKNIKSTISTSQPLIIMEFESFFVFNFFKKKKEKNIYLENPP